MVTPSGEILRFLSLEIFQVINLEIFPFLPRDNCFPARVIKLMSLSLEKRKASLASRLYVRSESTQLRVSLL